MSKQDFEGIRNHAKKMHDKRISNTPNRIAYAVNQFDKCGIEYILKNPQTGHFHCHRKSDDKLFQFYAGTGKIVGEDVKRGIHALIKILEGNKNDRYRNH